MLRRGRTDPLARQVSLTLAAGRLGVGGSALAATRPALRALGFAPPGATGAALGRVLGCRDLTLGALTVAARDDREALRAATLVGAGLDAADSLAFTFALADPETRRAGLIGGLGAAAAAIAGCWAYRRLGG